MVDVRTKGKALLIPCFYCKSELSYEYTEIIEDYSTDYLGEKYYYKYIICPNCGKKVIL